VSIRYRVRIAGHTRTVDRRARIRRGAFRITFTLPNALMRASKATVLAVYSGDARTLAQTRRATLRMGR
jgi:hypothetical protein